MQARLILRGDLTRPRRGEDEAIPPKNEPSDRTTASATAPTRPAGPLPYQSPSTYPTAPSRTIDPTMSRTVLRLFAAICSYTDYLGNST